MYASLGVSSVRRATVAGIILLTATAVVAGDVADPQTDSQKIVIRGAEVGPPVTPYVLNIDLRDLPAAPEWKPGDPVREIPIRRYYPPGAAPVPEPPLPEDPLLQRQLEATAQAEAQRGMTGFTTPSRNFAGLGYTGVNPPDTVGDVGPNHFIQSINTGGGADVRIWDKSQPPNILSTFRLDNLASGGACAGGFGDPILLYDRQADRWMLTEFAGSGAHLCVYISQTSDPVSGGWYFYDFTVPSFPDYPKFAVWSTDANGGDGSYLVGVNDGGPGAIALDRGKMLVGDPATFQRLGIPPLSGFGIQGPAPADPDGPLGPPSGEPGLIMRHRDTELHGGPAAAGDVLELWEFDVDWIDSGNTTLTLTNVDVADFDSTVCGTAFAGCFAQPNTGVTLFPIREVIMNRIQYYNHEDFESLVGNYVVDVGGNQGGVRWFELRRSGGGPWTTYQEGTYSIDDDNRWMASVAMDQSENLALAYSVSSSSTFPSLRYTGRLAADAPGVMTQTETTIHDGTASNSSSRWGDYAAMGLDPEDDCTFWFTSMDNTSSNWRTQVASFTFDLCGCLLAPAPPATVAEVNTDNQIDLNWPDSELETIIEYVIERSRTPGGPYEVIDVVPDSSPGFANGPSYNYLDTDVSGDTTYYYVIRADDGDACTSARANEVEATGTGLCTLRPIFGGIESAVSATSTTCTVELDWSAAVPECGANVAYNIYRSTTEGFQPAPANLLVGGVPGTSARDVNGLADLTTYHYVVRAVDTATGVEDLNVAELSVQTAALGSGISTVFFEDFEAADSFDDWSVGTGPGMHRCGDWGRVNSGAQRPNGGSGFYALALSQACAELLPLTSTFFDSPAIDLVIPGLVGVTLEADVYYNHLNGDDATIEVWDGSDWQVIWSDGNFDVNQRLSFDVSAHAIDNPAFQVRFNYQRANDDRWYSVDNVELLADINISCSTSAAPASAGDGLGVSTALLANVIDATTIDIDFDASCGATSYNLIHGDIASVGSYAIDGSECSIGTSGRFTWNSVPAGSVYFLVVGSDGASTESSWGSGGFGERNGLTDSGECGVTAKEISNVCQ